MSDILQELFHSPIYNLSSVVLIGADKPPTKLILGNIPLYSYALHTHKHT